MEEIKMFKMGGKIVKVNPILESIIRQIAEEYDLHPSTLRNTMILYGLLVFVLVENAPKDDDDFLRLLALLKEFLERRKKDG
jgi:hypothetical protein